MSCVLPPPTGYFSLRRTSSLAQSVLKISNGDSVSFGFRVICFFHNQLLWCVTTWRAVQTERGPELGRCQGVLENERWPLEHGEQRKWGEHERTGRGRLSQPMCGKYLRKRFGLYPKSSGKRGGALSRTLPASDLLQQTVPGGGWSKGGQSSQRGFWESLGDSRREAMMVEGWKSWVDRIGNSWGEE